MPSSHAPSDAVPTTDAPNADVPDDRESRLAVEPEQRDLWAIAADPSLAAYVRLQQSIPSVRWQSASTHVADAWTTRWLELLDQPTQWFVGEGLWEAARPRDARNGPLRRLRGDPLGMYASERLSELLARWNDGRVPPESRSVDAALLGGGGTSEVRALQGHVHTFDADEQDLVDPDGLLSSVRRPDRTLPKRTLRSVDDAIAWLEEEPSRPIDLLPGDVRRALASAFLGGALRDRLSAALQTSLLAQLWALSEPGWRDGRLPVDPARRDVRSLPQPLVERLRARHALDAWQLDEFDRERADASSALRNWPGREAGRCALHLRGSPLARRATVSRCEAVRNARPRKRLRGNRPPAALIHLRDPTGSQSADRLASGAVPAPSRRPASSSTRC